MNPTDPFDVVDRATGAVRGGNVPAPPDGLAAAALAATNQALALDAAERSHKLRRRIMRVTGIGGLVAATVVAATLLGTGHRADATELLKEALDNQAKAKSFRAVIKTTLAAPPPGMPATPEQRMFVDATAGATRIEMGDTFVITDGKQLVMFDAKAKVARTLDLAKGMPEMPKGTAEFAQKMRDALDGKAEVTPVPDAEIGGKARPGFKLSGVSLPGGLPGGLTGDVTYWLDTDKKLPLRYEMVISKPLAITTTMDYLAFDEKIDPKLFDMAIPEGYKQEELKLPAAPREVPKLAPAPAAAAKKVEPEFLPPPKK